MAQQLVLYVGTYCHLCHQAREVLYPLVAVGTVVREINIDDSPELKARYGLNIPVFVLMNAQEQVLAEKNWPFTSGQLKRILAEFSCS